MRSQTDQPCRYWLMRARRCQDTTRATAACSWHCLICCLCTLAQHKPSFAAGRSITQTSLILIVDAAGLLQGVWMPL